MKMNKKLYENDFRYANMKLEKEDIVYDVIRLVSYALGVAAVVFLVVMFFKYKSTIDMPINLKTHIQMQSKIMKKRQKKKE